MITVLRQELQMLVADVTLALVREFYLGLEIRAREPGHHSALHTRYEVGKDPT